MKPYDGFHLSSYLPGSITWTPGTLPFRLCAAALLDHETLGRQPG
jgi:hypothetical protein